MAPPLQTPSLTLATIAMLMVVGTASVAADDAPSRGPSGAETLGVSAAGLERQIFDLVNRHRRARGLRALTYDSRIAREARRHSAAMAAGSRPFGHGGFPDRIAVLRRVMPCGSAAENIATSLGYQDPAPDVLRGWLASSGHRSNIEGPYDVTGVGVARGATGKTYFTQIFVGR